MFSCTEEEMCVGVGGFMFWQILPSSLLYVWFLQGFDLYYIYIYIYIQPIYYVMNKFFWCLMRDTLLRDTSSIIGPDQTYLWCDKFIVLQTLNRQVKIYTIYICDTQSAQILQMKDGHFGTWCMWYARSFFIVYKSLLAKFKQGFP